MVPCTAEPAAARATPPSCGGLRPGLQTGFVGYRSDHRADDLTLRHDFLPAGQQGPPRSADDRGVARAQPGVLGAGLVLRRSAQAELIQASFELGELQPEKARQPEDPAGSHSDHASPGKRPRPTPPPAAPPTLAEQLLTSPTLNRRRPKDARVYEVKPAPERSLTFAAGTGPTISYVGVHYRAADLPESHDALPCAPIACRAVAMPRPSEKIREQPGDPQLKEGAARRRSACPRREQSGRWCRKCRWPRRRCVMARRASCHATSQRFCPRRHRSKIRCASTPRAARARRKKGASLAPPSSSVSTG